MSSDRNEPARFFGDGVVFKAKLIGILEVGEGMATFLAAADYESNFKKYYLLYLKSQRRPYLSRSATRFKGGDSSCRRTQAENYDPCHN